MYYILWCIALYDTYYYHDILLWRLNLISIYQFGYLRDDHHLFWESKNQPGPTRKWWFDQTVVGWWDNAEISADPVKMYWSSHRCTNAAHQRRRMCLYSRMLHETQPALYIVQFGMTAVKLCLVDPQFQVVQTFPFVVLAGERLQGVDSDASPELVSDSDAEPVEAEKMRRKIWEIVDVTCKNLWIFDDFWWFYHMYFVNMFLWAGNWKHEIIQGHSTSRNWRI